jgi:hypothetical protein
MIFEISIGLISAFDCEWTGFVEVRKHPVNWRVRGNILERNLLLLDPRDLTAAGKG